MVCMDTSFLVDLLRGREEAFRELEKAENEGERISTTAISVSELFEGAYKAKHSEKEVEKVRQLLRRITLLDFSTQACETYGKLANELRSLGRQIGDLDTLIASIALTHNEPILSRNIGHFQKVPGLTVRTW
jgi:tRNA(fMet)-specific endonuclease VapC